MSYPQQPYGPQPQQPYGPQPQQPYGHQPYAPPPGYGQPAYWHPGYGPHPYGPPPHQQQVLLPYPIADTEARVVQGLIDVLLQLIPAGIGWLLIIAVSGIAAVTETSGLLTIIVLLYLVMFLAAWGFSFYNHVWRPAKTGTDQTIGMERRHLRVMKLDGRPMTMGDHAVRWALYIFVEGGLIALIMIAATGRKQRLGDLAAKTVVVQLPRQ